MRTPYDPVSHGGQSPSGNPREHRGTPVQRPHRGPVRARRRPRRPQPASGPLGSVRPPGSVPPSLLGTEDPSSCSPLGGSPTVGTRPSGADRLSASPGG